MRHFVFVTALSFAACLGGSSPPDERSRPALVVGVDLGDWTFVPGAVPPVGVEVIGQVELGAELSEPPPSALLIGEVAAPVVAPAPIEGAPAVDPQPAVPAVEPATDGPRPCQWFRDAGLERECLERLADRLARGGCAMGPTGKPDACEYASALEVYVAHGAVIRRGFPDQPRFFAVTTGRGAGEPAGYALLDTSRTSTRLPARGGGGVRPGVGTFAVVALLVTVAIGTLVGPTPPPDEDDDDCNREPIVARADCEWLINDDARFRSGSTPEVRVCVDSSHRFRTNANRITFYGGLMTTRVQFTNVGSKTLYMENPNRPTHADIVLGSSWQSLTPLLEAWKMIAFYWRTARGTVCFAGEIAYKHQ